MMRSRKVKEFITSVSKLSTSSRDDPYNDKNRSVWVAKTNNSYKSIYNVIKECYEIRYHSGNQEHESQQKEGRFHSHFRSGEKQRTLK